MLPLSSHQGRHVGEASTGMRTIGLIGGMSWESTAVYYRRMNEQVRKRLGGLHSADILMRSVDFDAIVSLQKQGHWDEASRILVGIARGLESGGPNCIMISHKKKAQMSRQGKQAVADTLRAHTHV